MKILTFDLEEWFHILDDESTRKKTEWQQYERRFVRNAERILDLLDAMHQKATFFCLGWIAREYPDVIKKIARGGYDIGSHSDMHQLAYQQTKEQFKEDLHRSIASLEDLTGKKVTAYRAPGFSLTGKSLWLLEVLIEAGIEIDSSVFPARRAQGGLTKFKITEPAKIKATNGIIKEFPISMYPVFFKNIPFSGGGYFRAWPYGLIKKAVKESKYVMTYFHPRDFDPEQPIVKGLSPFRRFKSYFGLGSSFEKLKSLLSDYSFVDLKTAEASIDWDHCRTIDLSL